MIKKKRIAAQLFTLREHLKTPEDIAKSMSKVKKAGFDAVQVSRMGPIDPNELKKILDGEGLVCCATHEPGKEIIEDPGKVIEKLHVLDCSYTAYPHPHTGPKTAEDFKQLARDLSRSGKKMSEAGITLTYHNHAAEFTRFNGKTGLDIIYSESDETYLQGEIDTYWVQAGGGSPVEWCERLKDRLPLLHLKEYGIVDNTPTMLEVGSGNLNWSEIIKTAKKSGTKWYIIEQDTCRYDPFDSLKMSLDYLMENFVK